MTERQAFLFKICENPNDNVCRLSFADWLKENNEEDFGNFIIHQLSMDSKLAKTYEDHYNLNYDYECNQCCAARLGMQHTNGKCHCSKAKVEDIHKTWDMMGKLKYLYESNTILSEKEECNWDPASDTYRSTRYVTDRFWKRGFIYKIVINGKTKFKAADYRELFKEWPITAPKLSHVASIPTLDIWIAGVNHIREDLGLPKLEKNAFF